MTQDRSIFLHPPEQLEGPHPDETAVTRWLTHQAAEILRGVFHPYEAPPDEPNLLFLEAVQSAAIEGEHDAKAIQLHQNALTDFIAFSLDRSSLLRLHRSMMTGQGHAQPGRYRNVRVRVGDHIPPHPDSVPSLMSEFLEYAQTPGDNPVRHAAWAHIQFETIHPFADGNGRTGRALINHILQAPIPLSQYIMSHRQEYYQLLAQSTWNDYLFWFAYGVIQQSLNTLRFRHCPAASPGDQETLYRREALEMLRPTSHSG